MAGNKQMKKVTVIMERLKECWPDFETSATEFTSPSLASVIKFYERFMHEFGIRSDVIMNVLNQNYETYLENHHEDIMYVYVLYLCAFYIYNMLDLTSLHTFTLSLSNFIYPSDDKNLINRASLLSNYLCYAKLLTQNRIIPIKNQILEESNAAETINKNIHRLNEELMTAASIQARNIGKLESLYADNKELKKIMAEQQIKYEESEKKTQEVDAKLRALELEREKLAKELERNVQRGKELKSLVVEDHETLQEEYEQIEKDIIEAQALSPEYITNLESKTEAESSLVKNHDQICSLISLFSKTVEVLELREEYKSEAEKLAKKKQSLQAKENQELIVQKELTKELNDLEQKHGSLTEQVDAQHQYWKEEIARLDKKRKNLKEYLEKALANAQDGTNRLIYVENCCQQYKNQCEQQEAFYQKLYSSFLEARQKLFNKVAEVSKQINDALEAAERK